MKSSAMFYYTDPKGYAVVVAYDLLENIFEEINKATIGS